MSFLIAVPDRLATAATDLAGLGSTITEANAAAAAATTGVLPAAADEVSAAIAALFGSQARRIRPSAPRWRGFMTNSCRP